MSKVIVFCEALFRVVSLENLMLFEFKIALIFTFSLLFNWKISNKWFFVLIIMLVSLYVNFAFKTNIRISVDQRNTVPKEFLIDIIDKKITFLLINKDVKCSD